VRGAGKTSNSARKWAIKGVRRVTHHPCEKEGLQKGDRREHAHGRRGSEMKYGECSSWTDVNATRSSQKKGYIGVKQKILEISNIRERGKGWTIGNRRTARSDSKNRLAEAKLVRGRSTEARSNWGGRHVDRNKPVRRAKNCGVAGGLRSQGVREGIEDVRHLNDSIEGRALKSKQFPLTDGRRFPDFQMLTQGGFYKKNNIKD